jgi:hypothetical protein
MAGELNDQWANAVAAAKQAYLFEAAPSTDEHLSNALRAALPHLVEALIVCRRSFVDLVDEDKALRIAAQSLLKGA